MTIYASVQTECNSYLNDVDINALCVVLERNNPEKNETTIKSSSNYSSFQCYF